MNKLANDMKMSKGNGNTITLLFSLKGLEILHQERRGQVKTMVMEHFNGILFHKSAPVNKQHTNQSISAYHMFGKYLRAHQYLEILFLSFQLCHFMSYLSLLHLFPFNVLIFAFCPWNAARKAIKLVWQCHQLLSGFLAKGHLPQVSHQLLMIRVIMKWSWGLCSDLLAFALWLRKTSSRRPSDEGAVQTVITSNGSLTSKLFIFVFPYL